MRGGSEYVSCTYLARTALARNRHERYRDTKEVTGTGVRPALGYTDLMSDFDEPVDHLAMQAESALEAGELEKAGLLYAEVARRRPERAEAHLGLARIALQQGRPAAALEALPNALRADPQLLPAYELLALLGRHGGVGDMAIEWLEFGARQLPREPRLFAWLVHLYASEGRTEDLTMCLDHFGRLSGLTRGRAAILFTRDAALPEDLKSRIAIAAGF